MGVVIFVVALLLSAGPLPSAVAAGSGGTSELVGVLAYALDDSVARELGLTSEQKKKLADLIDARETEAVDLVMQTKDLSRSERTAKLAPFRRESEAKGLAILNPQQRAQLEKIRASRMGTRALAEPGIAAMLTLSQEQQKQIADLLEQRSERFASTDKRSSRSVAGEFDDKLLAVLTAQQRATWETLSGRDGTTPAPSGPEMRRPPGAPPRPEAGPPRPEGGPPKPQVAAPRTEAAAPEAASKKADQAQPAQATPPATTANSGAVRSAKKTGKLRFNFYNTSWKDVLNWLADEVDMSLVTDVVPPGTCNLANPQEYTPLEALNFLNSVLLTRNYVLLRRDRALMLINLDDGIPPNLLPTLKPEQLEDWGDFEWVSVQFQLDRMTPEEAEVEVRKLLRPQGSVIALPKSRQVVVTETAGRMKAIRAMIQRIEDPVGFNSTQVRAFELRYATSTDALTVLRQMLDIPEGTFKSTDGSISLSLEPSGRRIFATGRPEKLARVDDVIKIVDVAKPGQSDGGQGDETPTLVVYPVNGDPQMALNVLRISLAGFPDMRLDVEPISRTLLAFARPSQHKMIRTALDQLQLDARRLEIFHLGSLDPQTIVLQIKNLFGGGGDPTKGLVNPNAPQVDADLTARDLFVRGTAAQIEQIRDFLKGRGWVETNQIAGSGTGTVRMVPLKGRAAYDAVSRIQEIWPSLHQNTKIRVVTPSVSIPSIRPSASPEFYPPGGMLPEDMPMPEQPPAAAPTGQREPVNAPPSTLPPVTDSNQKSDLPPGAFQRTDKAPINDTGGPGMSTRPGAPIHPHAAPGDTDIPRANFNRAPSADAPAKKPRAVPPIVQPPSKDRSTALPGSARILLVGQTLETAPAAEQTQQPAATPAPAANEPAAAQQPSEAQQPSDAQPPAKTKEKGARKEPPTIVVAPGPGGVMIACEDPEVLNEFEQLLNNLAGSAGSGGPELTIFYLKYAKVEPVKETLEKVFSGGTTSTTSPYGSNSSGGLLGSMAGAAFGDGGGILGSLWARAIAAPSRPPAS